MNKFNLIEIEKVVRFEFDLGSSSLNNQTSRNWLSEDLPDCC